MAKPLNELRKKTSPEVQAAARAKAVGIVEEISRSIPKELRDQIFNSLDERGLPTPKAPK